MSDNFRHVLGIFIPLSPAFILVSCVAYLMQGGPVHDHPVTSLLVVFLCVILGMPFFAAFAIALHRAVLQGPSEDNHVNPFKMSKSEIGFLVGFLAIFLVAIGGVFLPIFVILLLSSSIGKVGLLAGLVLMLTCMIFALWLTFRLGFYLPAKAVNKDITFRKAYEMSRGLPHKIFWSGFLAALPVMVAKILGMIFVGIVITVLGLILSTLSIELDGMFGRIVFLILALPVLMLDYISSALGIIILSRYYQWAVQNRV